MFTRACRVSSTAPLAAPLALALLGSWGMQRTCSPPCTEFTLLSSSSPVSVSDNLDLLFSHPNF